MLNLDINQLELSIWDSLKKLKSNDLYNLLNFFHHRQSGLSKSAEASGQGITVVDSRSKTQSVQNSKQEKIKGTSGDHFKDLSKTSLKNFYPEVVTEHSLEVKLF